MLDFLQRLFLEDAWRLVILAVVLVGGTLAAWRRRPDRVRWWLPAVAAAVMVILFIVQQQVVTDREAVHAILDDLVIACQEEDAEFILDTIDDGYNADGLTKDDLRRLADEVFRVVDVFDIRLLGLKIDTKRDTAVARFRAICRVRTELAENLYRSRWELRWWNGPAGWKLDWVRPLPEEGEPAVPLEEMLR